MPFTKGELKFIYSPKHPGAIFIKVKNTKDTFICKVYPKETFTETRENADIIYEAFEKANRRT